MFKSKSKIKVAVGMSGGVDSSVAAALLKRQGYDVVGIFMKYWAESEGAAAAANKCCSVDSFEDGRRVSDIVGVPIYTYNFKEPFKEAIVDQFVREYAHGRTPNPCVRCNQIIKFGLFWEKARELGCDYIATGHYARLSRDWRGRTHLFAGRDDRKDQSYFLYRVPQEVLSHTMFPLARYRKEQVRALAKRWGIPTHAKAESQEICFVANEKHYEFVERQLGKNQGAIVTAAGAVLGTHDGVALYTVGQRSRLHISAAAPHYVVELRPETNEVVVSDDPNHPTLYRDSMRIRDAAWVVAEPKFPLRCRVRIRYRHPAQPAVLTRDERGYLVTFSEKQRAITPGQSAVVYRGDEVIGGGIIV